MQTFPEGALRNGGLELRLSNELCNHQFLLATSVAWSFHKKKKKTLLIDDLYLTTECSGSTEKLQDDVLKMGDFFCHSQWQTGG